MEKEIINVISTKDFLSLVNKFPTNKINQENLLLIYDLNPDLQYELLNEILNKTFSINRESAENDYSILQLIPYVYFLNESTDEVIYYVRSKQSGEKRLHDKISIGFGGHFRSNESLRENINREISEELGIKIDLDKLQIKGFLHYSNTPVSSVHLGIIFEYNFDNDLFDKIKINDEISKINKIKKNDLNKLNLEDWSKFIVKYFFSERVNK